ncbi:MAG: hypothetical protein ACLRL2_01600 [Dialister sp.]|jgi:hypothetical protein|uniref:hypothetical protein n=1 Tax=Dialister invisus TaxID=218538 RepID=UPI00266F50FF|nr:hypothetical protein [Dialister invisus]
MSYSKAGRKGYPVWAVLPLKKGKGWVTNICCYKRLESEAVLNASNLKEALIEKLISIGGSRAIYI